MSRFFVPPGAVSGDNMVVTGKEAHHIVDVMRLGVSDAITVFDGTGTEYDGLIREIGKAGVTIAVTATRRSAASRCCSVTLIQAVPKKDKMEYIVEKATELGVDVIIPVMTGRTIPQWRGPKIDAHLDRWRKIAMEASKQCGRTDIPRITALSDMAVACGSVAGCPVKLVAALADGAIPVKDALRSAGKGDVAFVIGPEGDLTADEIAIAKKAGFVLVDLGPRVLKSDTAGLAVLAMVNYEYSR